MERSDEGAITRIVAIDGPSGAGKSTVARRAARELGYAFLDTGAMYRAATWWAWHNGVDGADGEALTEMTRRMPLQLRDEASGLRVLVDGADVTEAIRSPEVTRRIYQLDEVAGVRAHLVTLQRAYGARRPTVAEGRDMGTVVFPDARCKVYLDAALETRARRRHSELRARGEDVPFGEVLEDMRTRDARTVSRAVAPLRRADDAVLIDTTHLGLDAVVAAVVRLAKERL